MRSAAQGARLRGVVDESFAAAPGAMAEDILPGGPAERRRSNRLYAIRAMDRLGLLDEKNLVPTLGRWHELRWLVDERGARWELLIELGRIRGRREFEAAVYWVLKARPRTEEAKVRIRCFGSGATRSGRGPNQPRPAGRSRVR